MRKRITYILGLLVLVAGVGFAANNYVSANQSPAPAVISAVTSNPPAQTKPVTADTPTVQEKAKTTATPAQTANVNFVDPVAVVKNPSAYLNRKIHVSARFDKFATLGLDYKPAYRSSENYISFLILRTDTSKNIPLSEMKLFMKRSDADKFIELKEGDKVQFAGTVFSNALGDVWVDVESLKKVN